MKRIILDTNVYGWYLSYVAGNRYPEAVNSFDLVSKLIETKSKIEVLGTETIEREIKDAKNLTLTQLFYSIAKGVVKKTKRIENLASEYFAACKKEKLHFVTIDDCEIVASKTLKIFSAVNSSLGLVEVKIMDSKNALGDVFA